MTERAGLPVPTEQDLAFFVAEDGFHGLGGAIAGHIRYWRRQLTMAREQIEPAREDIARSILSWLSLDGHVASAEEFIVVSSFGATPEMREGWRRTMIGGLATSMLARTGVAIDVDKPMLDGRAIGKSDTVLDLAINMHEEREWPYEPRIHVRTTEGGETSPGAGRDKWYYPGRLLICCRYPGDPTPGTNELLAVHGQPPLVPEQTLTILPHIRALHSPQFS